MYYVDAISNPSYHLGDVAHSWVAEFCRIAQTETNNPAIDNIRYDDWEDNPSSLMAAIYKQKRFDEPDGCFHRLQIDDPTVGTVSVAGAYKADFDPETVMVGCRAWTLPAHRSRFLIGDYILPIQLEWAIDNGCDVAMFTFNIYNAWLARMVLRASAGKALRPGMSNAPVYQGWTAHPSLCLIRNTQQIVLYKQLGVFDRIPDLSSVDTGIPTGIG